MRCCTALRTRSVEVVDYSRIVDGCSLSKKPFFVGADAFALPVRLFGSLEALACECDFWESRRLLGGGGVSAATEALSTRDSEAARGRIGGATEPLAPLLLLQSTLWLVLLALLLLALEFAGFPLLGPEAATLLPAAGVLGPSKLVPGAALPFWTADCGVGNWYGGARGGRSKESSKARSESSDTLAVDGSAPSSR